MNSSCRLKRHLCENKRSTLYFCIKFSKQARKSILLVYLFPLASLLLSEAFMYTSARSTSLHLHRDLLIILCFSIFLSLGCDDSSVPELGLTPLDGVSQIDQMVSLSLPEQDAFIEDQFVQFWGEEDQMLMDQMEGGNPSSTGGAAMMNGGSEAMNGGQMGGVGGNNMMNGGSETMNGGQMGGIGGNNMMNGGNDMMNGGQTGGSLTGSAPSSIVINEIDYDQPNSDQTEFIELFNPTSSPIDLANVEIDLISLGNQSQYVIYQTYAVGTLLQEQGFSTLLDANQYLVLGSQDILDATPQPSIPLYIGDENLIQNGPADGLILIDVTTSTVLDAVSYEGYIDGVSEGMEGADRDNGEGSLSRCSGNQDQNQNHLDFVQTLNISPGARNVCPIE